jgi:hypothetical protein
MEHERMTKLDRDLSAVLQTRQSLGVTDLKPHIEVSGATRPHDFKRALFNVLSKEDGLLGGLCLSTTQVSSVDELFE